MMNILVINFLIVVFGISIGLFIGRLLGKLKSEKEKSVLEGKNALLQSSQEIAENEALKVQKELRFLQQEKEQLLTINSGQVADLRNLQQKFR